MIKLEKFSQRDFDRFISWIDLGVFDFNVSAIKCYEKCGFVKEGLLRDSFVIDNEFYAVYNMSILRNDWES